MINQRKNIFYAHSGGVTSVINATACGLIQTARQYQHQVGSVYVGRNGILGALREELIDTDQETVEAIAALRHTPSSAFGTCRYKLKNIEAHRGEYERLMAVFSAHNIGYFFYNGGNDSQDTAHKIAEMSASMGYPLICIGIPKTVDNDLFHTDTCPGFGSAAKYVAVSIREAGLDVRAMCATSTKVFVLEVMGRHAGWIAAASGLAAETPDQAPHIILLPEVPFHEGNFLRRVTECVQTYGYCAVVASEGIRQPDGSFFAESGGNTDAFGHAQLGGVAPLLAQRISERLSYKNHWAVADYLQRSARHISARCDVEQAFALGKTALLAALEGKNGVMLNIVRDTSTPYTWHIDSVPIAQIANAERKLPPEYISQDGFHITDACREYLSPLIRGEDYPPYKNGLPDYAQLKNILLPQKLPAYPL